MCSCDGAKFGSNVCSDQYAPNTVGYVSSWGAAAATTKMTLGPWPGVSGITNTGWYWRVQASDYGIDGAPSQFSIGDSWQLPAATFNVQLYSNWWDKTYPALTAVSKATILSATEDIKPYNQFTCNGANWWDFCTNTGGVGPAYHFDGTHLFLRLVSPGCYNVNQRDECPLAFYDSGRGARVPSIMGGFTYRVTVTCPGCTVQSTVGGVTYWSVTDSAPAAFTPSWGTVTSSPIPQPKPAGAFSCPDAISQPPVASAGNGGEEDGSSTGLPLCTCSVRSFVCPLFISCVDVSSLT